MPDRIPPKPSRDMLAAGLRELRNSNLPAMSEADEIELIEDLWYAMERTRLADAAAAPRPPTAEEREDATALKAALDG